MSNELIKQEQSLTLTERLRLKRSQPALLLDISGSMSAELEPNYSKIQALSDIVAGVKGNPKIFTFNSSVSEAFKDQQFYAKGGTLMAKALNHIKSLGFKKVVMITDGIANDPTLTLEAVEGLELQILYVGPEPKPKFLEALARKANGYCSQEDLKNPKMLTEKIQLLLGSGEVKGAIQL